MIVETSPKIGATEVDPATTEISVTFDRDMGGGMSWTGGGPDFPKSPEGNMATWKDKRTCVLPVQLKGASYYRVGINSTSYQNFQSEQGVPAETAAIYFTTAGAKPALTNRVRTPKVAKSTPENRRERCEAGAQGAVGNIRYADEHRRIFVHWRRANVSRDGGWDAKLVEGWADVHVADRTGSRQKIRAGAEQLHAQEFLQQVGRAARTRPLHVFD